MFFLSVLFIIPVTVIVGAIWGSHAATTTLFTMIGEIVMLALVGMGLEDQL